MKTSDCLRALTSTLAAAFCLSLTACLQVDSEETETTGASGGRRLSLTAYSASQKEHAWSSATAAFLHSFGSSTDPCELRSQRAFGQDAGCCGSSSSACDHPASLEEIKLLANDDRFRAFSSTGSLDFNTVRRQIDNGNPILIQLSGFNGQYAVIYGYDADSRQIYIHDPYYGSYLVPYGTSFTYGGFAWWNGSLTAL